MTLDLRFLLTIFWTLLGGLLTAAVYDRARRDPITGVWMGALAAGIGAVGLGRLAFTETDGAALLLVLLWSVVVWRSRPLRRLRDYSAAATLRGILRDSNTWQALTLIVAAEFMIVFFAPRLGGLIALWDLLRDGLTALPGFVRQVVEYYGAIPARPLLESLLVGAIFGALATLIVALPGTGPGTLHLSPRGVRRMLNSDFLLSGFSALKLIGAGAAAGGIGAQILLYPIRHCTYGPDIAPVEYRMGLFVTVLSALLLLVPLWTLARSRGTLRHRDWTGCFRHPVLPYLLLLPTLIILILFLYYPGVQIMLTSLQRRIFPLPQAKFSCLANYVTLQQDPVYRDSFNSTLFITALIVLFSLSIALAIGVLASQKVKGAAVYRTLLVWPYAISPVVTGVIFLSMFQEGGIGILNWAIQGTMELLPDGLANAINPRLAAIIPGWPTPHWFRSAALAPWVIVAASVWNLLGFNVLFYIAGLQHIPRDLLEAAALDGANRFTRFWRITFPLLSPYTFFLLVTNITYSFYGIYGVVDTLTPSGGPRLETAGGASGATNVLIFKLYNDSFNTGTQAGFGAAQAVVLFLMVAAFTIVQFRFIERRVTYEA